MLYANLMLEASVKTYQDIKSKLQSQIIFFDRGILDTFCYSGMENIPLSKEMKKAAHTISYNKKVFILPPWKKIYENDTERKQTWKEAGITFDNMRETYLKYNYEVIEVPKVNVEKRREFILDNLELQ